jgi:hypothetical protein
LEAQMVLDVWLGEEDIHCIQTFDCDNFRGKYTWKQVGK